MPVRHRVCRRGHRLYVRGCPWLVIYWQRGRYLETDISERFRAFTLKDLLPAFKLTNATNLEPFKLWAKELGFALKARACLLLRSKDHGAAKSALASIRVW